MFEEYLHHWWSGDAAKYYHLFGLTLAQANKVTKVGQYLTGVLALFDLIAFPKVMGRLHFASYVAIRSYRFWQRVLNFPGLLLRLLLAFGSALFRKLPWSAVPQALRAHFDDAVDYSADDAASFPLVRALKWLELHPISDRAIKAANFCLFLFFSGVELLTS